MVAAQMIDIMDFQAIHQATAEVRNWLVTYHRVSPDVSARLLSVLARISNVTRNLESKDRRYQDVSAALLQRDEVRIGH